MVEAPRAAPGQDGGNQILISNLVANTPPDLPGQRYGSFPPVPSAQNIGSGASAGASQDAYGSNFRGDGYDYTLGPLKRPAPDLRQIPEEQGTQYSLAMPNTKNQPQPQPIRRSKRAKCDECISKENPLCEPLWGTLGTGSPKCRYCSKKIKNARGKNTDYPTLWKRKIQLSRRYSKDSGTRKTGKRRANCLGQKRRRMPLRREKKGMRMTGHEGKEERRMQLISPSGNWQPKSKPGGIGSLTMG